ncbi:MAG: PilW family protein [Patescibacteria group bacterium]
MFKYLFNKKRTNGFTLIEMMVYVALLGLLMVVFVSVFLLIWRLTADFKARAELNDTVIAVSEQLTRTIKQAGSYDLTNSDLETDFGRLTLITSEGQEEFQATAEGDLLWQTSTDVSDSLISSKITVNEFYLWPVEDNQGVRWRLILEHERAGLKEVEIVGAGIFR